MSNPIKEAFHKVHEAVWVIATVACLLLVKEWTKATISEILSAAGLLLVLLIAYHIIDSWRGWKLQRTFPWLFTVSREGPIQQIHEIEHRVRSNSTVFLVTPDLQNDARNQPTIDTVEGNLKRGVRYIYVTRDDEAKSATNIDTLLRNFAQYGAQVSVVIANDVFAALPVYNILVLEHDENDKLRAFIELPVYTNEDGRNSRKLWAEADDRHSEMWHERLLAWLKTHPSKQNPYTNSRVIATQ